MDVLHVTIDDLLLKHRAPGQGSSNLITPNQDNRSSVYDGLPGEDVPLVCRASRGAGPAQVYCVGDVPALKMNADGS